MSSGPAWNKVDMACGVGGAWGYNVGTEWMGHGYRKSGVWVFNWSVGIERVECGYSIGVWV